MGIQTSERARRIAIEGSPTFYYSNTSITASGTYDKEFETGGNAESKYLPFDTAVIANSSASDIKLNIGGHEFMIVANSVKTITDIGFTNLRITNLDAVNAIASDKIRIGVNKAPINQDKLIRMNMLNQRQFIASFLPYKTII